MAEQLTTPGMLYACHVGLVAQCFASLRMGR